MTYFRREVYLLAFKPFSCSPEIHLCVLRAKYGILTGNLLKLWIMWKQYFCMWTYLRCSLWKNVKKGWHTRDLKWKKEEKKSESNDNWVIFASQSVIRCQFFSNHKSYLLFVFQTLTRFVQYSSAIIKGHLFDSFIQIKTCNEARSMW